MHSHCQRKWFVTQGEKYNNEIIIIFVWNSENLYFVSNADTQSMIIFIIMIDVNVQTTLYFVTLFHNNWIRFCLIFFFFRHTIEKATDNSRSLTKWKSFDNNNNNFIAMKLKTQHEVFISFGFGSNTCTVCQAYVCMCAVCSLKFHFFYFCLFVTAHAHWIYSNQIFKQIRRFYQLVYLWIVFN